MNLMDRYKTDNLVGISPEDFEKTIRAMIDAENWSEEGYESSEGQRTASIRFLWGHDHDFGTFQLIGKMRTRHIEIMELFGQQSELSGFIKGASVLDVGCWTGGSSLLLAAMGAKEVIAIDEVKKYIDAVRFLKSSFNIENLTPSHASIYDMTRISNRYLSCGYYIRLGSFDVVYCAGVLYHLSDPIVGLRIMRDLLRPGGMLFLETAIYRSDKGLNLVQYQGPSITGWNWWFPTISALKQMMTDVGFDGIVVRGTGNRATVTAIRKASDHPLMQCGLSRRQ